MFFKRRKHKWLIRDWQKVYGRPKPQMAALLTRGRSGSHFVLHALHSHPQVAALEEHVLGGQLKAYFNSELFPIDEIAEKQLLPQKQNLASVDWILLNKPKAEDVTYHFPFQRDNLRLIYLFRNPVTLYYSWKKGWDEMAARDYGLAAADDDQVLGWLRALILDEMTSYGFYRNRDIDTVVSLESFTCESDENLRRVWARLGLPFVEAGQRPRLEQCPVCETRLEVQEDGEAVLYCPRCKKSYRAAGGYNYIGEIDASYLNHWKSKEKSPYLYEYFSQLLGTELMAFYDNETYLAPDSADIFEDLLNHTIDRICKI